MNLENEVFGYARVYCSNIISESYCVCTLVIVYIQMNKNGKTDLLTPGES